MFAAFSVAGCAWIAPSRGDDYRSALTLALNDPSCAQERVREAFLAYDRWTKAANQEAGYYRGAEADVLLSQAAALRAAGCDDAARVSYELLIHRFPGDSFTAQRERAIEALQTLPPPYPAGRSPGRNI